MGLPFLASRTQICQVSGRHRWGSQNCSLNAPPQPHSLQGGKLRGGLLGRGSLLRLIPSSPVNEMEASKIRLLHHLMYWNSLRGRGIKRETIWMQE